jgi:hypothetical protein
MQRNGLVMKYHLGRYQPQKIVDELVDAMATSRFMSIVGPRKSSGKSMTIHFIKWYLEERKHQVHVLVNYHKHAYGSLFADIRDTPPNDIILIVMDDIVNDETFIEMVKMTVDQFTERRIIVVLTTLKWQSWMPGVAIYYQ